MHIAHGLLHFSAATLKPFRASEDKTMAYCEPNGNEVRYACEIDLEAAYVLASGANNMRVADVQCGRSRRSAAEDLGEDKRPIWMIIITRAMIIRVD